MSYGRTGENNALSKSLDGIAFSVRKGTKFGRERRPFFNKMIKESSRFNFLLANILCGSEKSGKIYRETSWSEGSDVFEEKRKKSGGMEYSVCKEKSCKVQLSVL